MDLTTKYLGLSLKNPLIVGSSGLTNSIDNLKKIADHGAGAVVLKSIFEEQIRHETNQLLNKSNSEDMKAMQKGYENILNTRSYDYEEAFAYLSSFAKDKTLKEYLDFITEVKRNISIPVIASINCIFSYDWHYFARQIQQAGADAIELNIYVLPSDIKRGSEENEKIYFNIINTVKQYVSIPVSVKIGYYFSALANSVIDLSKTGVAGMVLFNRQYTPDFDINNFTITSGNIYSSASEYAHTLRWIGILSGKVDCDLAAATGIHDAEAAIKCLLAGATAFQITSTLYQHGFGQIETILEGIQTWMQTHSFNKVDDFRAKMSQKNIENPAVFERVQFMKLYSQIE